MSEKQGEFDVFNIETTLPQVDWKQLESQLQRAAEEEREKATTRRNDREEIRQKLAMGIEEDYHYGERISKKPNLQTRLQSGMNLQICFLNEVTADSDGNPVQAHNIESSNEPVDKKSFSDDSDKEHHVAANGHLNKKDENNFIKKQQRLQAEATMALAQVRPMAHMQLEVEKQLRKKSPIAEIVSIPGIGGRQRINLRCLQEMNVAQLQVVVNDLHSQIENLNEELVQLLILRDDLHMEQDSMLVDVEDFTSRRPQEIEAKNCQSQDQRQEQKADI